MSILPVHVTAGVLALAFGYVALVAAKGAPVHRKAGLFFVAAMIVMSLSGALMAAVNPNGSPVNVVAGLLTFYFVTTALLTVRQRSAASRWIDRAGILVATITSLLAFKLGADALQAGRPEGVPMYIFGVLGLLAAYGDIRVVRAGGIQGAPRLARHLWRMCFAMWIAAASFFWGPRGRVPEIIYIPALLPIPVLLPVAVMLYWLWRLRSKRRLPSVVSLRITPQEQTS